MVHTINLFAGPGAGKSTTAAGLFSLMKLEGLNVELVTEFAKEIVYEQCNTKLHNQLYVFAKQQHKLWRIMNYYNNKGEDVFIITDSPMLLALIYSDNVTPEFEAIVLKEFKRFNPINILLKRVKKFNPLGRLQTEEEAKSIDARIEALFTKYYLPYYDDIPGDRNAPKEIFKLLKEAEYVD